MTTAERALAWASEQDYEILRLEPRDFFDRFVLGIAERCGQEPVLVYDLDAIREAYVSEQEMTYEEADEYLAYNTLGAWLGDGTPLFLSRPEL
jgi:hypothetical protein